MTVLLKISLPLSFLFAVCIGLIHAQPYDDADLRALLTPPEGCPMPCFMGIRPGVTTLEEAVAILEEHEWVGELELNSNTANGQVSEIQWNWNNAPKELVSSTSFGQLPFGNIWIRDGLVDLITVSTAYSLGDFWLIWGEPDTIMYTTFQGGIEGPITFAYRMVYAQYQAEMVGGTLCPFIPTIWRSNLSLRMGTTKWIYFPTQRTYSNNDPFLDYIVELKRDAC